jgi:hypothetical protein
MSIVTAAKLSRFPRTRAQISKAELDSHVNRDVENDTGAANRARLLISRKCRPVAARKYQENGRLWRVGLSGTQRTRCLEICPGHLNSLIGILPRFNAQCPANSPNGSLQRLFFYLKRVGDVGVRSSLGN